MSRGNAGEAIWRSQDDCALFLRTLDEACGRAGFRIHAYVLMSNHYHLLLQTPEGNLVEGMRWFQQTFTQRFNALHRRRGHLFQGRYKAQIVESESSEGYFRAVGNYIHLNPARARLVGRQRPFARLAQYPWSSFPVYLGAPSKRPRWLAVESILAEHEVNDSPAGRREYGRYLEGLVAAEQALRHRDAQQEQYRQIRRGWYLGSEGFGKRILGMAQKLLEGKRPESFRGDVRRAVGVEQAESLIEKCMRQLNLKPADLAAMEKTDMRKYLIAWAVKKRTTVSNRWLSQRLAMGHYTSASNAVRIVAKVKDRKIEGLKKRLQRLL